MSVDTPISDNQITPPNFGVSRRTDDRVLAGLAGGIADVLGIDVAYVRAAFVSLLAASGLGAVLYAVGWLLTIDHTADEPVHDEPPLRSSTNESSRTLGFGIAMIGILLALSQTGLWLGPAGGAVVFISFGVATIWARSDRAQRARWTNLLVPSEEGTRSRREVALRAFAGAALVVIGLVIFFTTTDAFNAIGVVLLAVVITTIGSLIVLGPWVWRLWTQLSDERRERIRSEEREEMAAHLHDSVLQTLALIQGSKDPQEQAILARIQERELRSWLFSGTARAEGTLESAIEAIAGEVERDHHVAVETVTVGDCPIEPSVDALVRATKEALVNAAKHSGLRQVSVFIEVDADVIDAYITDHGIGFDPDAVNGDRRGIADSIHGRMSRHGGSAEIQSEPGEGTEVHLSMPRRTR